jgi:hypothetical protein
MVAITKMSGTVGSIYRLLSIGPFIDVLCKLELVEDSEAMKLRMHLEMKYGCPIQ